MNAPQWTGIFRISIWSVSFLLSASMVLSARAQTISSGEDYDVLVIPVGSSSDAPGYDLAADGNLAARGLQVLTVEGYSLGNVQVGPDRLTLNLKAGEGLQIFSQVPIPVDATSAYFSTVVSVTGEPLQQAAMALLDASDPNEQAVSVSLNQDIPIDHREYSLEYPRPAQSLYCLLQFVGPENGDTEVTLERMRLLQGYHELDYSLGVTAVTTTEYFGEQDYTVVKNAPPTTTGGDAEIAPGFNHTELPGMLSRSLRLSTTSADDVIQVLVPLTVLPGVLEGMKFPKLMYGAASVRRISGDQGTVTIALAGGITGSVGYGEYPVPSLPFDSWNDLSSPIQLSETGANQLFLIVQLRGGPAEVAVDDVSIQSRRDSMYYWDSRVISQ